jgi:hypothetical protein
MLREHIEKLRRLLGEVFQRGSAPGNAPVQTKAPGKGDATPPPAAPPKKKKLRFRVGADGSGAVQD